MSCSWFSWVLLTRGTAAAATAVVRKSHAGLAARGPSSPVTSLFCEEVSVMPAPGFGVRFCFFSFSVLLSACFGRPTRAGTEFRASTYTPNAQGLPEVAMASDGGLHRRLAEQHAGRQRLRHSSASAYQARRESPSRPSSGPTASPRRSSPLPRRRVDGARRLRRRPGPVAGTRTAPAADIFAQSVQQLRGRAGHRVPVNAYDGRIPRPSPRSR